jgi:hypothetical protein
VSLAGKVKVKVKSGTAMWHVAIILTDGSSTVQVYSTTHASLLCEGNTVQCIGTGTV